MPGIEKGWFWVPMQCFSEQWEKPGQRVKKAGTALDWHAYANPSEAQIFGACILVQTEAARSSKLGRKFHRISDDAISQGLLTIPSNACSSTIPPGQRSREGVMNPTLSMKKGWRAFCHLSGLPAAVYPWIQKPCLEPGPNQSWTTWHSGPKFPLAQHLTPFT